MNDSTQKEYVTYLRYVGLVETGILEYESGARTLARNFGFSLQPLKNALATGRKKLFNKCIDAICEGRLHFEPDARKLAGHDKDLIARLDSALITARQENPN